MFSCPKCRLFLNIRNKKITSCVRCPHCYCEIYSYAHIRNLGGRALMESIEQAAQTAPLGYHCTLCYKQVKSVKLKTEARIVPIESCSNCSILILDPAEIFQIIDQNKVNQTADSYKGHVKEPSFETEVLNSSEMQLRMLLIADMPEEMSPLKVPWMSYSLVVLMIFFNTWAGQGKHLQHMVSAVHAPILKTITYLISLILIHANFTHLFSNVVFFLLFCQYAEFALGPLRLFTLFWTSAIFGHALCLFTQNLPVGSSGGIFGLFIFFLLSFPYARLNIPSRGLSISPGNTIFMNLSMTAQAALIFFIGKDLLGFLLFTNGILGMVNSIPDLRDNLSLVPFLGDMLSPIAFLAHLGGGFIGFCAWVYLKGKTYEPAARIKPKKNKKAA